MLAAQSGLFGLMGEGDIQSCSPQKGLIWAQHEPTNSLHTHARARTHAAQLYRRNARAILTFGIKALPECDRNERATRLNISSLRLHLKRIKGVFSVLQIHKRAGCLAAK